MKRYHVIITPNLDGRRILKEYESEQGEWVKYEDVEPGQCNCAEQLGHRMAERPAGSSPIIPHWICPAHGYKKR